MATLVSHSSLRLFPQSTDAPLATPGHTINLGMFFEILNTVCEKLETINTKHIIQV